MQLGLKSFETLIYWTPCSASSKLSCLFKVQPSLFHRNQQLSGILRIGKRSTLRGVNLVFSKHSWRRTDGSSVYCHRRKMEESKLQKLHHCA